MHAPSWCNTDIYLKEDFKRFLHATSSFLLDALRTFLSDYMHVPFLPVCGTCVMVSTRCPTVQRHSATCWYCKAVNSKLRWQTERRKQAIEHRHISRAFASEVRLLTASPDKAVCLWQRRWRILFWNVTSCDLVDRYQSFGEYPTTDPIYKTELF